jgi:hypothetical protein
LALSYSTSTAAGPLEDARAAYDRSDYATTMRILRPLADRGNSEAESVVGLLYLNGWGVARDYGRAAMWYRKAADQGNEAAENNLGTLYNSGQGVPQDYALAFK